MDTKGFETKWPEMAHESMGEESICWLGLSALIKKVALIDSKSKLPKKRGSLCQCGTIFLPVPKVQVVEIYSNTRLGPTRDIDNARWWPRIDQFGEYELGKQERVEVIDDNGWFHSIDEFVWAMNLSSIVDEDQKMRCRG